MELLNLQELKEKKIQSNPTANLIHDWLSLHLESVYKANELSGNIAFKYFKEKIENILEKKKAKKFFDFMQVPLVTNELSESMDSELKRALDASDFNIKIEIGDDEEKVNQFNERLKNLYDEDFWQATAWDIYSKRVCSFIVVDAPSQQLTDRPEWYYYEVLPAQVVHVKYKSKDKISQFVFKSGEQFIGIDEMFYYVLDEDLNVLNQSEHNIGYAPVRNFWNQASSKDFKLRFNAYTRSLAKLNALVYWETSKDYYQSYGVWPITWLYEIEDSSENVVENEENYYHPGSRGTHQDKEQNLVGPGTVYSLPSPTGMPGETDLRPPVGFVSTDTTSIEFVKKDIETKKAEIFDNVVGKQAENREALNEMQVQAGFESKTNVLQKIADGFADIRKWVYKTGAKMQFEDDVKVYVSYGSDFYLKSESDLTTRYEETKKSGLPQFYLKDIRENLNSVMNRSNPDGLMRARILEHLMPYPDLTLKEMKELGLDVLDRNNYLLKANFNYYINKFEREEGNIVQFGKLISLQEKVDRILATLYIYVNMLTDQTIEEN